MKTRIQNFCILSFFGISYLLVFHFSYEPRCFFKRLTGFDCLTCGLTRSFKEILKGNILASFSYHLLGFPLFLFLVYLGFLLVLGIIKEKNYFIEFFQKRKPRDYFFVLFLFLLSYLFKNI